MSISISKSPFRRGVFDALPFLIIVAPFAFLFGVVAVEAGLNMAQIIGMSVAVFAGASQFTALQLMQDAAPMVVVITTALAVNLRMVMYSAAITPHLGQASTLQRVFLAYFLVDQTYALSVSRFEQTPEWTLAQRVAYFFGAITPLYPTWMISTVLGAMLGTQIPDWLALDFAVPICFLALVGPMLRTPAHIAAALTSGFAALAFAFVPNGMGLLIAAVLAMSVGAQIELWQERRGQAQ